jgi:hypothetical protein
MAVNSTRNSSAGLNIGVPESVFQTGSQDYVGNSNYVYSTNNDSEHENQSMLKQGDVVQYNGHISIVYDDPDPNNNYSYNIVHVYGNHWYDDDDDRDTPSIFSRKVIVTRHSISTPTGFGRFKLWD